MKLKKLSNGDRRWYVILCVLTGGMVFFWRVIITKAIKDAIEDEE